MHYADNHCTYTEEYKPEHVYVFTGPCLKTGKPYSVRVPARGLYEYRNGAKIQHAFPLMSVDDREFLMTGYSPEGWELVFGGEEEDGYDLDDENDG